MASGKIDFTYVPLCQNVATDGLRGNDDFPHCMRLEHCAEHGCWLRKWHGIPDTKMMPKCDASLDKPVT